MFKFGKYVRPKGPYDRYMEPKNMVRSARNTVITASGWGGGGGGMMGAGGQGGGTGGSSMDNFGAVGPSGNGGPGNMSRSGYNIDRYNPVYDQLEEGTILEDWIPRDGAGLDLLFRRIYLRDPIIGPGVDIIRNLPWSDYSLASIKDKAILKIYEDSMDSLQIPLLMPDVTGDHLIIGRNIMSVIFNERKGIFTGVVPHDPDFIRVSSMPVYGFDPLCDFKISPGFRKFLSSTDPRAIDARQSLPPAFLMAAKSNQGFLPLDPVSTIYLARKASQHDQIGTSLLTRCLYFWAIEKALLNAQMSSTRRRSRSFVHLMAGIDNVWEPTPDELDALAGMVIQANEDPVGGVIATRTGVTINEPVGGGQDFYKWSDELDLFSKYKMQAIGISEALLSGDATYNNAEQARSVFVENLATLRFRIVHKMFYQNLFPTLARLHGFVKRTKAEIDHNIRIGKEEAYSKNLPVWAYNAPAPDVLRKLTARKAMQIPISELQMPTIEWSKQLKPNQDEKYLDILEKLKNNEYPVTLKSWAQAAGLNADTIREDSMADEKLRAEIAKDKAAIEANSGTNEGDEEEGGGGGGGGEEPAEEGGEMPEIPQEEGGEEAPAEEPAAEPPPAHEEGLAPATPAPLNEPAPDVIVPEGGGSEAPIQQSLKELVTKVRPLLPKDMKGVY